MWWEERSVHRLRAVVEIQKYRLTEPSEASSAEPNTEESRTDFTDILPEKIKKNKENVIWVAYDPPAG